MSVLTQTPSFLSTSWRSTPWPWTDCTCSMTQTWCWQTLPLRTRSGWTGCNAGSCLWPGTKEKKQNTNTNLWMGRNTGQDKPSPLLHGRPAVRSRPRLREALWNDVPPKGNRGNRHPVAFRGMASLSFWMRLVARRFLLACCVYSVPLHATYIPKTHIWLFFFFFFISTFIFVFVNICLKQEAARTLGQTLPIKMAVLNNSIEKKKKILQPHCFYPAIKRTGSPITP